MNLLKYLWNQLKFSSTFRLKLTHNFHELTYPERLVYCLFIRPFWTSQKRFFFEGCKRLPGQMYIAERQALYEAIIQAKPRHCFEIGTYTGGGSTFFITSAFKQLNAGRMITVESNDYYYQKARNFYSNHLAKFSKFVDFVQGFGAKAFDSQLKEAGTVDCVFFDGSEAEQQTLDQYQYFSPYFKTNTVIMFHDWNTNKTKAIKPIILNDTKWKLIKEVKPPQSVGLAIFKRL